MTETTGLARPVVDGGDEPAHPQRRLNSGTVRVLAHAAWVTVLVTWAVGRVGRFGFNPTDQGFVLAQSWRVLHGQIPHTDMVSARPLGSALLHTVDFAVPGPLFVASSAVVMAQICISTIALAALVTGESPLRWGPLRTGLVATAALVNLHTFPLMAWHTIDGIFLTATGLWLLDSGLRAGPGGGAGAGPGGGATPPDAGQGPGAAARRRGGLLLLGFAVIVKQSFAFAAPLAVLILLLHPGVRGRLRTRAVWLRTAVDVAFLALVPVAYLAVVAVSGGLRAAVGQLTGGTQTWGERLIDVWEIAPVRRELLVIAALVLALTCAVLAYGRVAGWARPVLAAAAAAAVVYVVVVGRLARAGDWSIVLAWTLLFASVLDLAVRRRLPWRPLCLVLLAWMCSLSWGYPAPVLIAGSLALAAIELFARAAQVESPRPAPRWWVPAGAAVGAAAVLFAGTAVADLHDRAPYVDRPQGELTTDLGDVTPAMRWVRTNPSVHSYLGQIRDCTTRYPAPRVAVLPDNAFAYPAFGLRNPFPMDWPLPMELVGDARARMLGTVDSLNREGGYLVLFQTVTYRQLAAGGPVPAEVPSDAPIVSVSGLEGPIRDGLDGERVSCGSFVGVWSPATTG